MVIADLILSITFALGVSMKAYRARTRGRAKTCSIHRRAKMNAAVARMENFTERFSKLVTPKMSVRSPKNWPSSC